MDKIAGMMKIIISSRATVVVIAASALLVLAPGPGTGQMKSRNTIGAMAPDLFVYEAQRNLASIADAQIEYFIENSRWAGSRTGAGIFKSIGWQPRRPAHYAYYCGDDAIIPSNAEFKAHYPSTKANWPYGLFPEVSISDFTCMAIGNNDRDAYLDVWVVNKYRKPVHLLSDASNEVLSNLIDDPGDLWRLGESANVTTGGTALSNVYIEINLPAYRLDLHVNGRRVKSYPVAIGMRGYKTPLRSFRMERMEWNPWWIPPNAAWCKKKDEEGNVTGCKPVGPGASNPLGPVKMVLGSGYLIHGTNKPRSIGSRSSHGCIRMSSSNAIDLAWNVMILADTNQPKVDKRLFLTRSRRTYVVHLQNPVQVTMVYKRVEVFDGSLLVHPDTYRRKHISQAALKRKLTGYGFPEKSAGEFTSRLYRDNLRETMRTPINFK